MGRVNITIIAGILFLFYSLKGDCHNVNYEKIILHEWTLNDHEKIKGSFLMYKNDSVYIQLENEQTVRYSMSDFSKNDQQFVMQRYKRIQQLNSQQIPAAINGASEKPVFPFSKISIAGLALLIIFLCIYFFGGKNKLRNISLYAFVSLLSFFFSFRTRSVMQTNYVTDPLSVDSAFTSFKPDVVTSWDSNYFYIESYGIPATHGMMTGITSWQQQVPIPQCYIKPNAWMIPLNPVVAASPIPVDSIHFTRGAIAVAVNGIPVFNYHTNTGVDAYLDGQLDQWGGHCGRADDYHYHIAPMQLYNFTAATLPVAYALDGFAVYGTVEPDGTALLPLDANHGHYWTNGLYHYHGTATPVAPYMIANMVGQVTEDSTHQIIPQPHAHPVRPSLTPLNGAVITDCIPNTSANGYTVVYSVGINVDSVVYSWTSGGVYTFNFYTNGNLDSTRNYNGFIPCLLPATVIETASDVNIQLFPNPAHNGFSVRLGNSAQVSEIKNIMLLNMKGETIFSSHACQEKYDTQNLANGLYYVVLSTNKTTLTKKLIIQ